MKYDYGLKPLKFWCQKVLPLVYDESLSYEELLCKVVAYLNDVIEGFNGIPEYIQSLVSDERLKEILAELLDELREQIARINEGENTNASADRTSGELLWLDGKLARMTRNILAGDKYVEDTGAVGITGNFVYTSVEIELNNTKTALVSLINAEATARENADTALGGRITSETTARENADTALGQRIDNEITARENADTALGQRIDGEATARENADIALGGRISGEANARESADDSLRLRTEDIVNVGLLDLDFTSDISSDIQNLLSTHHRLYFPAGTYKFSITLTGQYYEIFGDGWNTVFNATTGACIKIDARNGVNCSDSYFHDFKIAGSGFNYNGIETIGESDRDPINNCVFRHIYITGCSYGIKWSSRGIWCKFDHIWSYGNYYGIWVETPSDCAFNFNSFTDCMFGYNQANGIILKSNYGYKINAIQFNHCNIESNFLAGAPSGDYDVILINANGISFNDCYIEGNKGNETFMVSNSDVVIKGGSSLVPTAPLLTSQYTSTMIVIGLHGYEASGYAVYSGSAPSKVCVIGKNNLGYTLPTGVVDLF